MKKVYVLDTNILIHSPDCLFGFADNELVITTTTIDELDKLKNAPGETGYGAREAIRRLKELKECGNLYTTGAELKNGGTVRIVPDAEEPDIPPIFKLDVPDNRIINTVKHLQEINGKVYLITNDNGMLLKAGGCGIEAQDYKNESLLDNSSVYTGITEIPCMSDDINTVKQEHSLCPWNDTPLYDNEFVILSALDANYKYPAKYKNGKICKLEYIGENTSVYGVIPRNITQRFALEALLAPVEEIPLVFLMGTAGTAKTFLSLAAGMEVVFRKDFFDYILITRNNVSFDEDIGFLPGSEEEKITPLLRCFTDNLESLVKKAGETDVSSKETMNLIESYFDSGVIRMEAMNFMRGRSIQNAYVIVDEAQNASVGQIKGILTRPGLKSKIVLCGDPEQIDNPKVSRKSNGLVYAAEKMKNSSLSAQVTFSSEDCIRSPLAREASEKL